MKAIVIAVLLAAPLPALAQKAPATHEEAQRIVRAEAERWRYPLIEDEDTRYPDIIGTIATLSAPECQTIYTITFPAFPQGGKQHPQVIRTVQMLWSTSTRPAIVDGTTVTLTWRLEKVSYTWTLETETPERARAFAAAADFLTQACAPKDTGTLK